MHALKPGLADCARWLSNAESVAGGDAEALFAAADTNKDGRVDLLELMRAAYKWAPLADDSPAAADDSLAAARDSALDFFLLLGADPVRGLDREQFAKFLQAWCLQGGWGFKAISHDLIRLLHASDYLRQAQDKETAAEIQAATVTPATVAEWMERRRPELLYNLWAGSKHAGRASREQLCNALSWFLEHVSDDSVRAAGGSKEAARRFLEAERRRPPPHLAQEHFRHLERRFTELAGQPTRGVDDYLMTLAVNGVMGGNTQTGAADDMVFRRDLKEKDSSMR
ncbi:hypothetical protein COCSUDRAFT_56948 [Coccomyxa subellipsoidea C-169]|uniref:EF-hand domain-containing protein n=1 Tax=Coccomyxa subellipsoidea (strain C-169) TaxID=574566 RepID=I0YRK8_COCSC|nr:hypothetical protein COCSUDRAFT_56948 [Coccomyxa subellipsoidea C-169]EIE21027.1 hypothetical protein COCSUDRAFT_56948 [Coccomyxa subellipsoidea C-169]|eukprot:XP_005645571.1 hypothetical protein COCSUDRAFT_56948 [Coccomyxa subellipsoidea C-169]